MSFQDEIFQIADELRGIANISLNFTSDPYDKERYEKILAVSSRMIGAIENRDSNEILEQYQENLAHASPFVGAASVVRQDGKVLLIQRTDNQKWALPGGLVEVGDVLSQAALRELEEEACISGSVVELLGIFDSRIWHSRMKSHLFHFVFLVEPNEEDPKPGPEALKVGYFAEDHLPDLSPGHDTRLPFLFRILRGEITKPYFDKSMEIPVSID